ncbi:unnamed protein product, partial [marine sediment metagenome]
MVRGFDHLQYNMELVLSLRMEEGVGTLCFDWSKPHHVVTLVNTPAWTNLANDLTVLDFDAAGPDHLISAAAGCTDLDFTTGAFSGACWVRADALGNRNIMTHGVDVTDGWYWWIDGTGAMRLVTNQAAASQTTIGSAGDIVVGTWRFIGFSRDGASVTMYTNGADATVTPAVHINPVTAAARNFYVGVNNAAGAGWYDGDLWNPRVWGRALTAVEHAGIFEMERTY